MKSFFWFVALFSALTLSLPVVGATISMTDFLEAHFVHPDREDPPDPNDSAVASSLRALSDWIATEGADSLTDPQVEAIQSFLVGRMYPMVSNADTRSGVMLTIARAMQDLVRDLGVRPRDRDNAHLDDATRHLIDLIRLSQIDATLNPVLTKLAIYLEEEIGTLLDRAHHRPRSAAESGTLLGLRMRQSLYFRRFSAQSLADRYAVYRFGEAQGELTASLLAFLAEVPDASDEVASFLVKDLVRFARTLRAFDALTVYHALYQVCLEREDLSISLGEIMRYAQEAIPWVKFGQRFRGRVWPFSRIRECGPEIVDFIADIELAGHKPSKPRGYPDDLD